MLFVIHDYFISYVLNKAMEAISTSTHPTEKMQKMITSFVKVFDLYKPHISVFYQESGYLKPLYASAIKEKEKSIKRSYLIYLKRVLRPESFVLNLTVRLPGCLSWEW